MSFDATPAGVVAACEHFLARERDRLACNFFVQDVCAAFGVSAPVEGQANDIALRIGGHGFEQLLSATDAAERAAQDGWIVLAAASSPGGHGHVALITPGPLKNFASGTWPLGYWGALSGSWSGKDSAKGFGPAYINFGFNSEQRKVLRYGAIAIAPAGEPVA
ncbi:MAG: hypothetical protein ACK4UO_17260 [Pseudolabrys sp.]